MTAQCLRCRQGTALLYEQSGVPLFSRGVCRRPACQHQHPADIQLGQLGGQPAHGLLQSGTVGRAPPQQTAPGGIQGHIPLQIVCQARVGGPQCFHIPGKGLQFLPGLFRLAAPQTVPASAALHQRLQGTAPGLRNGRRGHHKGLQGLLPISVGAVSVRQIHRRRDSSRRIGPLRPDDRFIVTQKCPGLQFQMQLLQHRFLTGGSHHTGDQTGGSQTDHGRQHQCHNLLPHRHSAAADDQCRQADQRGQSPGLQYPAAFGQFPTQTHWENLLFRLYPAYTLQQKMKSRIHSLCFCALFIKNNLFDKIL